MLHFARAVYGSNGTKCENIPREGVGALVQWLKLPALKIGDRGFVPRSGVQVSMK